MLNLSLSVWYLEVQRYATLLRTVDNSTNRQPKGLQAALQGQDWSKRGQMASLRWSRQQKLPSLDPYLAQHHDNTVGIEEAAGVSLIQAQSRFHGEPGASPKIIFH